MNVLEFTTTSEPKPFVKWAGGKSQLTNELRARLPQTMRRYFEPFLGGGALYFSLCPSDAYLSDINSELVNAYEQVKNSPCELIRGLATKVYDKEQYYEIRGADRANDYDEKWSSAEKAVRFIYLNKTGFNGLYRVNARGQFNVSFGRYKNPKICDEDNILACSAMLSSTVIACHTYLEIENLVAPGDFVYFDPPYIPMSSTANFRRYSKEGFTQEDHLSLRDLCQRLDKRGVYWMLSSSASDLAINLFGGFRIESVKAKRSINSNASRRGSIDELIIRNY